MGRLTLNILLSFAQFEREVIGERIRDKFAASRAKGMWMGGCPPMGYDVKNRKLVVNPAEVELVRLIFRRFLDLGSALLLIRELNAQGHRTKSWTTQAGTFREGRRSTGHALQDPAQPHLPRGGCPQGQELPGRARADHRPHDLGQGAQLAGDEREAPGQRGAGQNASAAQRADALHPLHLGNDADPHAAAERQLYRYYICLGASRRGHDTCGALGRRQ
jgi:site-specific DNA recombinase